MLTSDGDGTTREWDSETFAYIKTAPSPTDLGADATTIVTRQLQG